MGYYPGAQYLRPHSEVFSVSEFSLEIDLKVHQSLHPIGHKLLHDW